MNQILFVLTALVAASAVAVLHAADEAKPLPGNLKPLKDYKHEPLQGIDSIVGKVVRKDGFTIQYEIGRIPKPGGFALGGDYSNYVARLRPEQVEWTKEQATPGGMVHLALTKEGTLMVSLPAVGANLSAQPKTPEDTVEVILTALSMSAKKP